MLALASAMLVLVTFEPARAETAAGAVGAEPSVDDAYLKAMQMDEEDEFDESDEDALQRNVDQKTAINAAPVDPAEALKEKIDDIVDWAPEEDLDCE